MIRDMRVKETKLRLPCGIAITASNAVCEAESHCFAHNCIGTSASCHTYMITLMVVLVILNNLERNKMASFVITGMWTLNNL